MSIMKKNIGLFAAMASMMDISYPGHYDIEGGNQLTPKDIDITPKEKPIPKGCKRYYYNKQGLCCESKSEVYFDALKPSTANRKYQNWLKL